MNTDTTRKAVNEWLEKHGVTVSFEFVPWSKSRSYKPGAKLYERTFEYLVTLKKDHQIPYTFEYGMGIGHSPTKRGYRLTAADEESIIRETESGLWFTGSKKRYILPEVHGVLACLASDYMTLDYRNFEEWAGDYGYDPDSRKGEQVYRDCLAQCLEFRRLVGDDAAKELQEITAEW